MNLACYASNPANSIGRMYNELQSSSRNVYQRDRDRIIHSASFRRLQYKTQVFVNHEGDMFRSRLTHSLEVSQIARGLARTLNCHEDLAEAISLAHDLGHTPFGHAGQDALNSCMKKFGGFEHNLQSLRVVDQLEKKYAKFDGLNLSFEVREGILKHCSLKNAKNLGKLGQRFINKTQPSLEAQIVNLADEIAYLHHDLDDGFRSGILTFNLMRELRLFNDSFQEVCKNYHSLSEDKLLNEIIRRMMNLIIGDVVEQTSKLIIKYEPASAEAIRNLPPIVKFSLKMIESIREIRNFSRQHLYRHPRIASMSKDASETIRTLFEYFLNNFDRIPLDFRDSSKETKQRIIADYIAGMTDRFANQYFNQII